MISLTFSFRLISKDNFKSFNRRTGRPFLSREYKAFEEKIAWFACSQYKGQPLEGDLRVSIAACYKNKIHPDAGNLPKSLCDALNKIIWQDDRQIKQLKIIVKENNQRDWFSVGVEEIK